MKSKFYHKISHYVEDGTYPGSPPKGRVVVRFMERRSGWLPSIEWALTSFEVKANMDLDGALKKAKDYTEEFGMKRYNEEQWNLGHKQHLDKWLREKLYG